MSKFGGTSYIKRRKMASMPTAAKSVNSKRSAVAAVGTVAPLGGGPRALGGGKSDAALGREQSSAKRQRLSAPQSQPPTPSMASIGRLSELVATLGELKAGLSTVSAAIGGQCFLDSFPFRCSDPISPSLFVRGVRAMRWVGCVGGGIASCASAPAAALPLNHISDFDGSRPPRRQPSRPLSTTSSRQPQ